MLRGPGTAKAISHHPHLLTATIVCRGVEEDTEGMGRTRVIGTAADTERFLQVEGATGTAACRGRLGAEVAGAVTFTAIVSYTGQEEAVVGGFG
jgi:hypothetical protein